MTNYRRYDQDQATNPKLIRAIEIDLRNSRWSLRATISHLEEALNMLKGAPVVPEDFNALSSGIPRARYDIHTAINGLKARVDILDGDLTEYIKSVAGFMSPAEAEAKLREYS